MLKGASYNPNAGNYIVSGRSYSAMGLSSAAGSLPTADIIYAVPFLFPSPVSGVTQIIGRVGTIGVTSSIKFGMALVNGTTATMVTDLNPTGVATTSLNDVICTVSPFTIKANTYYVLCAIGTGATMAILTASNSTTAQGWAQGFASTTFASTNNTGFTNNTSTYAAGFPASFTLTQTSASTVPFLGFVAP